MSEYEKMTAVRKIQIFIDENYQNSDFSAETVYEKFAYSQRHLNRLFKEFTGKTVSEYISAMKITNSAEGIKNNSVLNTAVDSGYDTCEGYTKAFKKQFGVTPNDYKKFKPMIPLFVNYPVNHQFDYYRKGENKMNTDNKNSIIVCNTYIVSRPARKLILFRSQKAEDYWSFCQEKGCEWFGYLNSNEEKFDTPAILTLPESLVEKNTGKIAAGIEVPESYETDLLSDGYEIINLPPTELLYIQSQPFENEDDFCRYIDAVNEAYNNLNIKALGYEIDTENAASMNFGAEPDTGAKIAFPVKRI